MGVCWQFSIWNDLSIVNIQHLAIFPVTCILLIRCFYTYSTYISQSHEKQTLYGDYFQNSPLSILSITEILFLFWIETWKLIETYRIDMILWRLREFGLVWINFENFIWNLIHRKVCSMKQDRSISADFSMGFWIICAI